MFQFIRTLVIGERNDNIQIEKNYKVPLKENVQNHFLSELDGKRRSSSSRSMTFSVSPNTSAVTKSGPPPSTSIHPKKKMKKKKKNQRAEKRVTAKTKKSRRKTKGGQKREEVVLVQRANNIQRNKQKIKKNGFTIGAAFSFDELFNLNDAEKEDRIVGELPFNIQQFDVAMLKSPGKKKTKKKKNKQRKKARKKASHLKPHTPKKSNPIPQEASTPLPETTGLFDSLHLLHNIPSVPPTDLPTTNTVTLPKSQSRKSHRQTKKQSQKRRSRSTKIKRNTTKHKSIPSKRMKKKTKPLSQSRKPAPKKAAPKRRSTRRPRTLQRRRQRRSRRRRCHRKNTKQPRHRHTSTTTTTTKRNHRRNRKHSVVHTHKRAAAPPSRTSITHPDHHTSRSRNNRKHHNIQKNSLLESTPWKPRDRVVAQQYFSPLNGKNIRENEHFVIVDVDAMYGYTLMESVKDYSIRAVDEKDYMKFKVL